jgi:hypothetical protein
MGLVTKNYTLKKTGLTIENAYAKLRTFVLNADDSIRATFGIHTSRENLENYSAIEIVEVSGGKWDRKTSLQVAAYEMARTQRKTVERYNKETGVLEQVVEDGPLYGWNNDIILEG